MTIYAVGCLEKTICAFGCLEVAVRAGRLDGLTIYAVGCLDTLAIRASGLEEHVHLAAELTI